METKFKIKLPFKKNSAAAKASAHAHKLRLGKDPYFDWTIILALFVATSVLWLSFGYALWRSVEAQTFDASAVSSAASSQPAAFSLNTNDLEKVISAETAKSVVAAPYQTRYTGPVDPSR